MNFAGDVSKMATLSTNQGIFEVKIVVTPVKKQNCKFSSKSNTSGSIAKLPSIYSYKDKQWVSRRLSTAQSSVSSRYHKNCGRNSNSLDVTIDNDQLNHLSGRSSRSPSVRYDVNSLHSAQNMSPVQLTEDAVKEYLRSHPEFLEKCLLEHIGPEKLESVVRRTRRRKQSSGRKEEIGKWKFGKRVDKKKIFNDLTHSLQNHPTKDQVLWEMACCISSAVNADHFRLYIPEVNGNFTAKYSETNEEIISLDVKKEQAPIANNIFITNETIRITLGENERFSQYEIEERNISHILALPILESDDSLVAILELYRCETGFNFEEEDEEIAMSYLVWGGIALHYAQLNRHMIQQKKLNDFLLTVVKSIFQDMASMDTLVKKIMNFAQELVDADRASLFLVDSKNKELYATIFDNGIATTNNSSKSNQEIRFSLGKGIAGEVAMTGKILNIPDAYSDSRFNRSVDQMTGYKTKNILCMPIYKSKGSIIGVVQMVNKKLGSFSKEDEEAFEMFAVYCGLALHHTSLYDTIRTSEQKYKVALEVLSYHSTCTDEEFQVIKDDIPEEIIGIDDYYFNQFSVDDYNKVKYSIFMFKDLFGFSNFDKDSLLRFTLTVKKNYRRVPYHNWTHGFSVAHCMYTIIKHSDCFQFTERLALYIGALCHDLDHRGKNNKFMLDTESPLANIYSTSTMENHHFNQTVTILQQEGHNIFSKFSSDQFKQVLAYLKHCILATDLALFFPNKTKLSNLINEQQFSFENPEHRGILQAIAMTGSDLCASAKPWDVQVKTVEIIFEEFYEQGDAERAAGRTPLPMMDRNQVDQKPASQVGFLMGICKPCYSLLFQLMPQTKALLDKCEENLKRWQEEDAQTKIV